MSIQQWEDRTSVALSNVQDVAVQRLGEWAQSADAAYQVAERLSSSAFVPAQFKGKPVELTAAILSGLEVGLSPMAAMRAFDVIQGQAAARAITLRAIAQSHGHEMVVIESTSARCRMKGKRRGSDEWQTVTWDITRAQALGLTGKDNWKKQPGAMLLARATSELARLIASDAILGIGYSAEEVADGGTFDQQVDEVVGTPAPPTGTRKMSRKPKPANEDGSPARDEEGQMKAMHASFNEAGITERQDRLDFAMSVVNREIESSADLTWDERSAVIEALKAQAPASEEAIEDAEVVEP
jgi:hypothetical protein